MYYDIIPPTPLDGWPGFVKVHRVYCFDFYNFEPDQNELEAIFECLPGFRRDRGWTWFGESLSHPPCLKASSNFNGLTVVGSLPEADWRAWDAAFRERASHLPMQRDEEEDVGA
jgi:hypothetical protein